MTVPYEQPRGIVGRILLGLGVVLCLGRLVAVIAYEWDRKGREERYHERLEKNLESYKAFQEAERVMNRPPGQGFGGGLGGR